MKYYELQENDRLKIEQLASDFLRNYAYSHGGNIYSFMKANKIGESVYGQFMDAAAQGRGVIAHRLYGHHFLYDFPVNNIKDIAPFLEHLFSDLFTKQGLPILPSELLKNAGVLKCCDSIKHSWNFVNGFDILSGTIAIFSGFIDFKKSFIEDLSIDSFGDFIKTSGFGAIEMAIAFSTANPFLLIGGILSLTSGLKGLLNSKAKIYFKNIKYGFSIEFAANCLDIEAYLKEFNLHDCANRYRIDVKQYHIENAFNTFNYRILRRREKKMTNNEFRQIQALLENIIDDYRLSIKDFVSASLSLNQSFEEFLNKRRREYDFAICEMLNKSGTDDPELYINFDKIWANVQLKKEKFLKEAISAFADKTSKTSNIFRSIYDIKIGYDLTLQILQAMLFFNEYLNDTKDYVLNYLKQQIEKEG